MAETPKLKTGPIELYRNFKSVHAPNKPRQLGETCSSALSDETHLNISSREDSLPSALPQMWINCANARDITG